MRYKQPEQKTKTRSFPNIFLIYNINYFDIAIHIRSMAWDVLHAHLLVHFCARARELRIL